MIDYPSIAVRLRLMRSYKRIELLASGKRIVETSHRTVKDRNT